MKQFEVTDYKADVDWDDIIPEEELKKLKDEEQKRKDDEYIKEQLDMMNRRDNALKKIKHSVNGDGTTVDSDDESSSRTSKRRARNDLTSIGESEIRAIYKAVLKYGDLTNLFEELISDGNLPVKSIDKYQEVYAEMMEVARENLHSEEAKRKEIMEKLEKKAHEYRLKLKSGEIKPDDQPKDNPNAELAMKRKEKKAILFTFYDVKSLNAESFIGRAEALDFLRKYIHEHFKDDPLKFHIANRSPKAVQNWSSNWNKEDDEKLLVGVFKYGYGSWTQIRDDPFLGLTNKIFLNDSSSDPVMKKETATNTTNTKKGKGVTGSSKKVPGAIHLGRRVDYLISVMRDESQENTPSATATPTSGLKRKRQTKLSKPPTAKSSVNSTPSSKRTKLTPKTLKKVTKASKSVSNSPTPVNKKRTTSNMTPPGSENVIEKEYESMDEDECRHAMAPVRLSLKKLRNGNKGLDRKEFAHMLKSELTNIGDHIESQKGTSKKTDPVNFKKHLWSYSSHFWPANVASAKLMAMYDKIIATKESQA